MGHNVTIPRWVLPLCVTIGGALFALGVHHAIDAYRFSQRAVEVTARATEHGTHTCSRTESDSNNKRRTVSYTCYDTTYVYTYEGVEFTQSLSGESSARPDTFPVWVDPSDPSDGRTDEDWGLGAALGLMVFAVMIVVIAVGVVRALREPDSAKTGRIVAFIFACFGLPFLAGGLYAIISSGELFPGFLFFGFGTVFAAFPAIIIFVMNRTSRLTAKGDRFASRK